MESTKLTSKVTIENYRQFKADKDTKKIANLVFERFNERYIQPFKSNDAKHGFILMASSCLMIESLYCFQHGRKNTRGGGGGKIFDKFFTDSSFLNEFSGMGEVFYKNIRCGILHQGETYHGWKIRRTGRLLNKEEKIINATKFLKAIEDELRSFTKKLS